MISAFPPRGLYVITSENLAAPERLAASVRAALRGGAGAIQYRAKRSCHRLEEASLLLTECRAAGVPFIVNDDVELALEVGADGVHLGKEDGSLEEARARLGENAIVGVSCYDSVERAVEAAEDGADYLAFGRFFPSRTKPGAPCARLETLSEAKRRLGIPIVAIGGIAPENGGQLLAAGADWLATVEAVCGAQDPEAAARKFMALWI
jgi:thiamine-phosphate pyrophosphorylase